MIMQLKIWLFKQLYKSIAKHGREGDTELAHVNSYEVELLRLVGGSGTINPATGLREFKGGGGGTQTTSSELDPIVKPFVEYGLQEAKGLYQQAGPEYYPEATYIPASTQTQSALQSAEQRALAGSPLVPQAQATISGLQQAVNPALAGYQTLQAGIPSMALPATQTTASGAYLGANPFLAQAMSGAASAATQRYNDAIQGTRSGASQAGRYGSNAMFDQTSRAQQNLANALSQEAGRLMYQNFGTERGLQEAAVGRLGDISQQQFNQQLAATQGLGSLAETQAGRQMAAAQVAPQMALADYADINQLALTGQTYEDYAKDKLNADIARFEYGQNLPYAKLESYLAGAYGAPTPMNQTTTQSGGGK